VGQRCTQSWPRARAWRALADDQLTGWPQQAAPGCIPHWAARGIGVVGQKQGWSDQYSSCSFFLFFSFFYLYIYYLRFHCRRSQSVRHVLPPPTARSCRSSYRHNPRLHRRNPCPQSPPVAAATHTSSPAPATTPARPPWHAQRKEKKTCPSRRRVGLHGDDTQIRPLSPSTPLLTPPSPR
jgi:hypothetical protein